MVIDDHRIAARLRKLRRLEKCGVINVHEDEQSLRRHLIESGGFVDEHAVILRQRLKEAAAFVKSPVPEIRHDIDRDVGKHRHAADADRRAEGVEIGKLMPHNEHVRRAGHIHEKLA